MQLFKYGGQNCEIVDGKQLARLGIEREIKYKQKRVPTGTLFFVTLYLLLFFVAIQVIKTILPKYLLSASIIKVDCYRAGGDGYIYIIVAGDSRLIAYVAASGAFVHANVVILLCAHHVQSNRACR